MKKQVKQTSQHRQRTNKGIQEEPQRNFKGILPAHCQCDEINRNQRKLPEYVEHQPVLRHKYAIQRALHEQCQCG